MKTFYVCNKMDLDDWTYSDLCYACNAKRNCLLLPHSQLLASWLLKVPNYRSQPTKRNIFRRNQPTFDICKSISSADKVPTTAWTLLVLSPSSSIAIDGCRRLDHSHTFFVKSNPTWYTRLKANMRNEIAIDRPEKI